MNRGMDLPPPHPRSPSYPRRHLSHLPHRRHIRPCPLPRLHCMEPPSTRLFALHLPQRSRLARLRGENGRTPSYRPRHNLLPQLTLSRPLRPRPGFSSKSRRARRGNTGKAQRTGLPRPAAK